MVSGTLNNSNFYSFKSYWIFEILVNFQTFKLPKRIRNLKLWLKFQTFKLPKRIRYLKLWLKFQTFKIPKRIRYLKLWLKFQTFKIPYFQISKLSNFQIVLEV